MQILPIRVFSKIAIRRAFRDKTAIFFVFAFPLIFLFIFGGIFGKNNDLSFKIGVVNESDSQIARQLTEQIQKNGVFKLDEDITSLESSREKMRRGQLDATIILPKTFGQVATGQSSPSGVAQVYYTQNSEQAGNTLTTILEQQFTQDRKSVV